MVGQVLAEHDKTWQTNGLADLHYEVLKSEDLNPHAIKHTVDVQLNNGHWTDDQVDPKPPEQPKQQHGKHRQQGGRGGGWRERDGDRDGKRPRYDDHRGRSDRDRDDRRR